MSLNILIVGDHMPLVDKHILLLAVLYKIEDTTLRVQRTSKFLHTPTLQTLFFRVHYQADPSLGPHNAALCRQMDRSTLYSQCGQ